MERNDGSDHGLLKDGEFPEPQEPRHPSADVAVPGPNSRPTGSRFETSSENYAAGFPDVKPPKWLALAAAKYRAENGIEEPTARG